jgi:hypothetical protein
MIIESDFSGNCQKQEDLKEIMMTVSFFAKKELKNWKLYLHIISFSLRFLFLLENFQLILKKSNKINGGLIQKGLRCVFIGTKSKLIS